jgi:single-strand DNA-binding protein
MNKVILLARLCADPELKDIGHGRCVANLRLAHNRKFKNRDGQQQEEVLFIDASCFGKTAEAVCGSKNGRKFFSKGSRILIEGKLKLDRWEDKHTGGPRSKISVVIDRWEFVDELKREGGNQAAPRFQQNQGQYRGNQGQNQGEQQQYQNAPDRPQYQAPQRF